MSAEAPKTGELAAAYEGLEDPRSFPDQAALERYRSALASRTVGQVDFLAERLPPDAHVLEIGCGNGRLLVELARRGSVAGGLGIDLAASRVDFARTWADALELNNLQFEVGDVLEQDLPKGPFAAVCCITGAFAYFDAVAPGSAAQLARRMAGVLEPGGVLCVEIYPHPAHKRLLDATEGNVRIWSELPEDDPWRFYLSDLSRDGEILTHEKTFIHRTNGRIDSGRRERLYLYTEASLAKLLLDAGFEGLRAYEDWSSDSYAGGEVMVATAVTPSPT
jgi:SAM-dependent methyltransferase